MTWPEIVSLPGAVSAPGIHCCSMDIQQTAGDQTPLRARYRLLGMKVRGLEMESRFLTVSGLWCRIQVLPVSFGFATNAVKHRGALRLPPGDRYLWVLKRASRLTMRRPTVMYVPK